MKSKAKKYPYPTRAANVPVTQHMLYGVRDQLQYELKAVRTELKGDINSLKTELKTDIHKLGSEIHQIKILVEEQNAKNNIVLDGLVNLFERQDRIEKKVESR